MMYQVGSDRYRGCGKWVTFLLLSAVHLVSGLGWPKWNITQGFALRGWPIAFVDEITGIVGVYKNGLYWEVWSTTDGGSHWVVAPSRKSETFTAGDAKGSSAVLAGSRHLQYSNHGKGKYKFEKSSVSGASDMTQYFYVKARNEAFYAAIGNPYPYDEGNVLAISTNGGADFKATQIDEIAGQAQSGAFPSDTTWYVCSVSFSSNKGQVVKTEDAGQTWKTVLTSPPKLRMDFTAMDCEPENPNHCCVSGTVYKDEMVIYCTYDGGKTWNQSYSQWLITMEQMTFINANTIWGCGGAREAPGYFWLSTDGGRTWTAASKPTAYYRSMSWPSVTRGYVMSSGFYGTALWKTE